MRKENLYYWIFSTSSGSQTTRLTQSEEYLMGVKVRLMATKNLNIKDQTFRRIMVSRLLIFGNSRFLHTTTNNAEEWRTLRRSAGKKESIRCDGALGNYPLTWFQFFVNMAVVTRWSDSSHFTGWCRFPFNLEHDTILITHGQFNSAANECKKQRIIGAIEIFFTQ